MDYTAFATFQLVDLFSGPLKTISGQMGVAQAQAVATAGSMERLTKSMLPLTIGAAAVAGGLLHTVNKAAEFEKSMSAVRAATRGTPEEMARLEKSALDLGASTAFSAMQVAQAQEALGKAGLNTAQILAGLPGVLDFAAAGEIGLAQAADTAADVMTAFRMEASQLGEIGDIMAATANKSTIDINQLSQSLKNSMGVAAAAGVGFADLNAVFGLLATQGNKGLEAGTHVKTMLLSLMAPSGEAASKLRQLGVVTRDSHGNLLPFLDIMSKLETGLSGKGSAARADVLKSIFGADAVTAATQMMVIGTANVRKFSTELGASSGSAAETAAIKMDNLKGAVEEQGGAWESLRIIIGRVLLPAATAIIKVVGVVTGWFARLADSRVGQAVIRIAAAVSTAILAFASWTAVCWAVSAALPYLAGMLAAITWPVWLILGAITALALAWESNFGGMADKIKEWWGIAVLVVQGVVAVFESLNGAVGEVTGKLAEDIEAAGLVGLVTTVGKIVFRIKEYMIGLYDGFMLATEGITGVLAPVLDSMQNALRPIGAAISQVVAAVTGLSGTGVSTWAELGRIVGTGLGLAFRAVAVAVRMALVPVQVLAELLGWIIGLFTGTGDSAQAVGDRIISAFTGAWATLADLFPSLVSFFDSFSLYDSGVKLLTTLGQGIMSVINLPSDLVRSGLQAVRNLLPFSDAKEGPLSSLTLSGQRLIETIGAGVASAASGLADTVGSALGLAVEPVAAPVIMREDPASPSGAGTGRGRQVVIRINNLNLPGVSDADGFISQIQRLTEQYDISGEVALA